MIDDNTMHNSGLIYLQLDIVSLHTFRWGWAMLFKVCLVSLMCTVGCGNITTGKHIFVAASWDVTMFPWHVRWSAGLLLSPAEEAVVCEGQQLELICTTNATFLQWSWSWWIEQGKGQMYSRFISSTDVSQQVNSFVMNSISFNTSRASLQGWLPLVSRLLINPMNIHLNGTIKVSCTEIGTNSFDLEMASTTINIVGACKYSYCNTTSNIMP